MSTYKRAAGKSAGSHHSNAALSVRTRSPSAKGRAPRAETKTRGGGAKDTSHNACAGRFSMKYEKNDFQLRTSLKDVFRRQLEKKNRTFDFQRVFMFGKNILPQKRRQPGYDKEAFKKIFEPKLNLILGHCEKVAISGDLVTGLLIYMGDWSMLMVESCEDLVGEFLMELAKYAPELWSDNRIFYVEDRIQETYFNEFCIRRAPEMNTKHTFSACTPDDARLMAVQHFKLLEKATSICQKLKRSLPKGQDTNHISPIAKPPRTKLSSGYHKLLPEVQVLEILMSCTKFYRRLDEYVKIYYALSTLQDDKELGWPMKSHYTPSNVFTRSAYETNLSFADYTFAGKTDKKLECSSYVDPDDGLELRDACEEGDTNAEKYQKGELEMIGDIKVEDTSRNTDLSS